MRSRLANLTRYKDPKFLQWKARTVIELNHNPNLRRLDCMNPNVAFRCLDCMNPNVAFSHDPILSRTHDVSMADLMHEWRSFTTYSKNHILVPSVGVRDSLLSIFENIGQTRRVSIPRNIYPVYQQIIQMCGTNYQEYSTFPTFDVDQLVINADRDDDVILITKNYQMSKQDVDKLTTWVKESRNRLIVVDAVYTYDYSDTFLDDLVQTDQVIVCHSLSKSHLLPLHFGTNLVPERYTNLLKTVDQPDQLVINRAFYVLTTYPDIPRMQQERFTERWRSLGSIIKKIDPRWRAPQTGYFSSVPVSFEKLIDKYQVLGISSQVFYSDANSSVITCLHDIRKLNIVEKTMYHVTVLSNFARAYDKYSRTYDKKLLPESTYPDQFFVLHKSELNIGIKKAQKLWDKLKIPNDRLLILETKISDELRSNKRTGLGQYVCSSHIEVFALEVDGQKITPEDAYAMSLKLSNDTVHKYEDLVPRSVSVLPVAKGCQAKCPFCFSHSSISDDQRQKPLSDETIEHVLREAKKRGANRAVITGGGEPTLLPHPRMIKMIEQCAKYYGKVVMITNGYNLGHMDESNRLATLLEYQNSGLSVLSISRHGVDSDNNAKIMNLDTKSDLIANTLTNYSDQFSRLKMRWVCVLQKGGVHDEDTLKKYLDWVRSTGIREICFKELYVSTSQESVYHDNRSNIWSLQNQIPLKLVLNFVKENGGEKIGELPWGSPIYRITWKDHILDIAIYTEPSVYWERKNKLCRSWNLLADGTCYASLEDRDSAIALKNYH